MYAADELLTQRGVRVNVFERLPTPYGLVRAGVAPTTRAPSGSPAVRQDRRAARFRFYLNVEVGSRLSPRRPAGAPPRRALRGRRTQRPRLDIDGMGMPRHGHRHRDGRVDQRHPEYTDLPVDLTHERVVVIGNGNVALDVARILTTDPDVLARTDISDHALAALRQSKVTEVVIAARRGPAQSAFTLPELIGLTSTCDVVLDAADHELVQADLAADGSADAQQAGDPEQARRRVGTATRPRIRLATA
jgi:ferredoxin--NADP+ reductase